MINFSVVAKSIYDACRFVIKAKSYEVACLIASRKAKELLGSYLSLNVYYGMV